MKLRLLLITLFMGYFACAQGLEDFSNIPTASTGTYLSRTWTGTDGVTWNATAARTDQTLNGKAICTSGSGTITSPTYVGGMGVLNFSYVRAFTGTSSRSIQVWVNGSQIGATITVSPTSDAVVTYNQPINVSGNVVLELRTSGAQIKIDDISWTTYSACTPPADPSGTISVTSACGSSSLIYSSPSATAYWQTNATGTDTSFPTTTSYTALTSGTYYVRIFDGSCWSTNSVSQGVTIINPVSITTQPTNQATTTGATATFNVVATNATSYQWQVSTDGGSTWSNIGIDSNSYTTPATTLGMDGYLYRVLISGTAPCTNVTSSEATLTVTTGPCLSQTTFSSAPSGWLDNSISYSSGEAVFGATNGDLTTVSLSNPTSLTFDLRRTTNTSAKDLFIEVSTTTQTGSFTTVATYNLGNTTSGGTTSCTVDLSSYTVYSTVYIRFRKSSSTTSPWYIQDVSVFCGTPPSGPEINVTGNGVTIVDGDTTPSSTDNTNFGSTLINTNIIQTFVIQNIGTTDLSLSLPITLSDTSLPQEFTITQPSVSTIAAGGSTFFTVTFNSAVAGLFTNTITITNSDSDESLYNFDILAIASNSATGGTVFRPGELIFTGYDGQINGSGAEDEYLVATLVDILPGTVFSIVNSRYEAGAAAGIRTNKWGGGGDDPSEAPYQAEITYNGSTLIPAGSVLQIVTNGTSNWFGTINVITNNISSSRTSDFSGSVIGGTFLTPNISTSSPDQMYLVQGGFTSDGSIDANQANYYLTGTLLHGLTNRAAWVPLTSACSGSSSTTSSNPRESRLPSALTCFNVESISASAVSGYYENDKEHGIASLYQIINAVADVSNNWTLGTGRYNLNPSNTVVTSAGRTFEIGPSNPSGQWVGDVDTNWFNCANWSGLAVPDANTDVIVTTSATNVARIDYTAAYSDDYSDLATCKNIDILGSKVEIYGSNNNILEVYGDLLLDTTGVLDMDDSNSGTIDGRLLLHGNWTNNIGESAFDEGNGTVVFKGLIDQIINAVTPVGTEIFYNVVLNNNFTTSTSNNLIATGNLNIEPGKIVTVNANDFIQVNNNLTVDGVMNVLNNGSLIQINDLGVNTGDISYERNTTGSTFDYVYWSSPVEGFDTPSTGHVFVWNPIAINTNGGLGTWNYALSTTMESGVGYIMRDVFSNTFNGLPRNGVISTIIQRGNYTGSDYSGTNGITITNLDDNLNLIGNPYPSSINAIDFLAANTNIEGAVRIWTHGISPSTSIQNPFYGSFQANYSINDYIIYNSTGTSSGPGTFNGYIAGGQGFFTIMNDGAATSETVVFNNAIRSRAYDNSQFYRNAATQEKNRIWLDLITETNKSARTLVGYVSGATMGRDRMYDAVAIGSTEASIYSIINDKYLSIQGRFPFNDNDTVPLGINIVKSGLNSIAIFAVDGLFDQQEIYIEDLYSNTIHNLKLAPYNFNSDIGVFNNRFVLRFKDAALSNDIFVNTDENIQLITNQNIEISTLSGANIKSVIVYDILARKIIDKKNINNSKVIIDGLNKNNTTLIVKIELDDKVAITRKVIF
ncbi:choice-of-anchor D domain-containing protein [Flavobacterium sp. J27]|uniref:choice-of-anchor D domain-containing protein n=1 Tax=Flavobacterium sp. J27 TaxID=2060419 RepID=UPI001031A05B|nr:choice-of-anchor D domain-containing protein [Flavobacterium sp. J27]